MTPEELGPFVQPIDAATGDYPKSPFKIGLLKAELGSTAPDFLDPMTEDERVAWEGGN
jgi:hypothetical protein